MENIDVLHKAAKFLVDNEKMTGDEFRKLFVKETPELIEDKTVFAEPIEDAFETVEANEGNKLEEAMETIDEAMPENKTLEVAPSNEDIHENIVLEALGQVEKDGVHHEEEALDEDDMK